MAKGKCSGYGMFTGIFGILVIGIVLGVVLGFVGLAPENRDIGAWAASMAYGLVMAYILLAAVDYVVQFAALKANPLPREVDVSDREIAAEQAASMQGGDAFRRNLRRLLRTWSIGAPSMQVVAMERNQSARTNIVLVTEAALMFAVLFGVGNIGGFSPKMLGALGILYPLVALVVIARIQLASRQAGYIEAHLFSRIGAEIEATAVDFAGNISRSVAASTEALMSAQSQVADQLAKAQETASRQLAQSQQEVATQLARVGDIAAQVDKILNIQQTVEGTLKGVVATDDFRGLLNDVKQHLEQSVAFIQNASKPRVIKLVEKDSE